MLEKYRAISSFEGLCSSKFCACVAADWEKEYAVSESDSCGMVVAAAGEEA